MKGEHKPGYRAPRTGERRQVRQPFAIDKLDEKVRAEIQKRRAQGQTWQEIADASPEFAGQPLSVAALHRWYDVRVAQVQADVQKQIEHSQALAAEFAGTNFEKLPEAVQSALSSAIFALAEQQDERSRARFIARMGEFAWLLARNRQLDQEDKRLELEGKKLDLIASKVRGLKGEVGKKKMSAEELGKKLDEIYDIAS